VPGFRPLKVVPRIRISEHERVRSPLFFTSIGSLRVGVDETEPPAPAFQQTERKSELLGNFVG
jgi:hypothetical protein